MMGASRRKSAVQTRAPDHYLIGGRSVSRAVLLAESGFHQACNDRPDCEIVVLLHTAFGQSYTALIAIPRDHIAKAAIPPFWRHGEVMHIDKAKPP